MQNGVLYEGAIIVPLNALQGFWIGDGWGDIVFEVPGDYAAAVIVMHEFGHHLVDGFTVQQQLSPPTGKNGELLPDCLAGVSAYAVQLDGILEMGDIEEALGSLLEIGDYDLTSPDHHGTPQVRYNAFLVGFSGSQANPTPGVPQNCLTGYWS